MPAVQRKEFGDKKKPLWIDVHTEISGGQRTVLSRYADELELSEHPSRIFEYQQKALVLLCEAWSFPDPDKPEEVLPKSLEGVDRARTKDLDAAFEILAPIIQTAFPNP